MAKSGTVPSGGGGGGGTVGGGGTGGVDGGITFVVPNITIAAPAAEFTISLVDPVINNSPIPIYENLTLVGTNANETLLGGMGNDHLDGGSGDDLEIGGAGSDTLTSSSGIDSLAGGTGDDVYILTGGEAHIEDFQGHDTIDASDATGNSYIDLSGGSISHVEDHDVYINGPGTTAQKLDVQFLQDLTGSFADDIANVRTLIPGIVTALQAVQPDAMFGVSSFRDKPLGAFGGVGDYVYQADVALTTNAASLTNAYNAMTAQGGNDWAESQIESLMHLALNTAEVGFRADAARFVVLFTDAPYHVGGEGLAAGVSTSANNGDAVIDLLEDYPMVAQLKAALEAANIIPVFAVTPDVLTVYQDLVAALGRGTVTAITPNSADVVAAVTAGLAAATTTYIEDVVGGSGDDTLIGSLYDNSVYGGSGNDSLTGNGGNDKITGGDGVDTAKYSGNHADYSVTLLADSTYQVTDLRAGSTDGSDILSGIETLTFADESISLVLVDPAAQAAAEAAALAAAQAAATAAAHAAELAAAKAAAEAAVPNAQAAANAAIANAAATHTAQAAASAYAAGAAAQASSAAAQAAAIGTNALAKLAAADAAGQAAAAAAALALANADATAADAGAAAAIAAAQAAVTAAAAGDAVAALAARDTALNQAAIVKAAAADAIAQMHISHEANVAAVADAQTVQDIVSAVDLNIVGTAFHDVLGGGFGNDTIDGGAGSDDMAGGKGNDTYIVESKGDIITELANQGVDNVLSSADYTLSANVENLTITGTSGRAATGNELNNIIIGNVGDNIINGMAGNDVITGGGGTDNLTGGLGNDIFKFNAIADSVRGNKHDIITDFTTGDKIDLSQIDANTTTAAVNDAFNYIGAGAFTKVAGQLRYDAITHNLLGDINGDGGADFEINLLGVTSLTTDDFVL
jgi:Ca2+-binding RTX toxin-like protein